MEISIEIITVATMFFILSFTFIGLFKKEIKKRYKILKYIRLWYEDIQEFEKSELSKNNPNEELLEKVKNWRWEIIKNIDEV
jgi:hypothetical protein